MSTIQNIPLHDIEVDHTFNARSGAWAQAGETPDGHAGMAGLVESIKSRGQDTEVVVRPNVKGKSKAYFLVNGFRRYEALRSIAEANKDKGATIKAKIRELTDIEARALNVRENTSREDFTPADLAFGVAEMAKSGATDTAIAAELGLTQAYVSRLHTIVKETRTSKTFEKWRSSPVQIQVIDMYKVAKMAPEKQTEAYEVQYSKVAKVAAKEEVKWFDRAMVAVQSRAGYLGKLVNNGLLSDAHVMKGMGDFAAAVSFFANISEEKHKPTAKQISKLAAHALACYEETRDYVEPIPEPKEEKPAKAAKSAKNGAAVAQA